MCSIPNPLKQWVICRRERRHKGKHGAIATNPGQWTGNRPPGKFVTLWGSEFEGVDAGG